MERITRAHLEARAGNLNRRLVQSGRRVEVQGRNGATSLDEHDDRGCIRLLAAGTKREMADHLHAMMQGIDLYQVTPEGGEAARVSAGLPWRRVASLDGDPVGKRHADAANARLLLDIYANREGSASGGDPDHEDYAADLADLVCDLLHLADEIGATGAAVSDRAWLNYDEELRAYSEA